MSRILFGLGLSLVLSTFASAQPAPFPAPVEGDFVAREFAFDSGERMAEVKIHYRTVGTPRKDADGVVRNGVLILHGTGGSGSGFLSASYGGRLFGTGQPLELRVARQDLGGGRQLLERRRHDELLGTLGSANEDPDVAERAPVERREHPEAAPLPGAQHRHLRQHDLRTRHDGQQRSRECRPGALPRPGHHFGTTTW